MTGTRQMTIQRPGVKLANDPARSNQNSLGDGDQIVTGTIGHEDGNPQYARIQNGQIWVEVTMRPDGDEIVARLATPMAGNAAGWMPSFTFGCRVLIAQPDGDPGSSYIIGQIWDGQCPMPTSVAGLETGSEGLEQNQSESAPTFQFIKTPAGKLLAIETGAGGDVLIHTDGSLNIKVDGAMHVDGAAHLGAKPTTQPVGTYVAADGKDTAGAQTEPYLPPPYVPVPNSTPTHVPYVGFDDGIIRAKDNSQFSAVTDPTGYTQFAAVYLHPMILLPPPIALVSQPRNGASGQGSKHTASD